MKPLYIVAVNLPAPTLSTWPTFRRHPRGVLDPRDANLIPSEITYPRGEREFSDRRPPVSRALFSFGRVYRQNDKRDLFLPFAESSCLYFLEMRTRNILDCMRNRINLFTSMREALFSQSDKKKSYRSRGNLTRDKY